MTPANKKQLAAGCAGRNLCPPNWGMVTRIQYRSLRHGCFSYFKIDFLNDGSTTAGMTEEIEKSLFFPHGPSAILIEKRQRIN